MAKHGTKAVADVAESETEDTNVRYLRNRTKRNVESTYHPTHNKNSVAEIPEMVVGEACEQDRDLKTIVPPELKLSEEDVSRLKQKTSHLPFDKVLEILCFFGHDVNATIKVAEQMADTELVPDHVKDLFVANIPFERDLNPSRKMAAKEFYMSKTFRKVVPTKSLVDFYYNEKNKIDGNWRLELEDWPTIEKREELERKMKMSNISIIRRDPTVPIKKAPRGRGKKAAATRRANSLLRAQQPGCSKERDEVDSDSASVTSTEPSTHEKSVTPAPISAPTFSSVATNTCSPIATTTNDTSSDSSASTPTEIHQPVVVSLKFRFSPFSPTSSCSIASSASSSSSEASITPECEIKPKKQYRKRTIEEQRGGAQKLYPGRMRQPRKVFDKIE